MGKFDNVFAYSLSGGSGSGSGTGTGTGSIPTTGLTAEWKMEEVSGNRLDTSGNNNTLVPNGAIASAPGKIGLAAVFDRTAKMSLPSVSQLNLAADFTVTLWVKFINVSSSVDIIFSKYNSLIAPANGLMINLSNGKFQCFFRKDVNPNLVSINAPVAVDLNTYYFVALTHKPTTKTLDFTINRSSSGFTVDTVNGNPNPYNITMINNNANIVVGGWADDNQYISNAHIDQVRIYNRVLSSAELDALYAET